MMINLRSHHLTLLRITVQEAIFMDDTVYLIMELAVGGELFSRLNDLGAFCEDASQSHHSIYMFAWRKLCAVSRGIQHNFDF